MSEWVESVDNPNPYSRLPAPYFPIRVLLKRCDAETSEPKQSLKPDSRFDRPPFATSRSHSFTSVE